MCKAPPNASGHDFSRAESAPTKVSGFSPCDLSPRPKQFHEYFRSPSRPAPVCAVFLFLIAISALPAQSVQIVSPQQCVWHAGDNPAWAAPNLDETGWQPYAQWKLQPDQPFIWVRCHADLTSLGAVPHPAIQISLFAAHQLFLNGEPAGGSGNLRTGNFSMNTMRSYPIPAQLLAVPRVTIAARITYRYVQTTMYSHGNALEIRAGDESMLDGLRAQEALAGASKYAIGALCYGVIGVFATMLFALFLYDRSRRELLLLSIVGASLAVVRLNEFFAAALAAYPASVSLAAWFIPNLTLFTICPFYFALAKRRLPVFYWIVIILIVLKGAPGFATWFVTPAQALWLNTFLPSWLRWPELVILVLLACVAPFVAFWPYSRIPARIRPLAILCMLWGSTDLVWYIASISSAANPAANVAFTNWRSELIDARAVITASVLAALMALLFREQRQATQERALLAGEMLAASEIQRMLAPAVIDTAPGLRIDVAFHPMREVGGDFYLCRVLADGRQRVLLGDVSGKGAAAAMTATLLIGAAERRDADSPTRLLDHLNLVLQSSRIGGFATCVCADLAPDGAVTLANAGHLPPYLNGHELAIESGLPLGIASAIEYAENTVPLAPGDTLVLLSDGVAEARNEHGQLFGFDRTRQISTQSAEAIAAAAQLHGQEDDITVLTLTFAPAEVLHA